MSFTNPNYLVETDWLADHLDDPGLRVLDVTAKLTRELTNRAEGECFEQGHIPGSSFFDVSSGKGVLSDPDAALPWMWPSVPRFEEVMGRFGVENNSRVVLVAATPRDGIDSGTMWCTRAWWTMHHMGVDCAILRGGLEKWKSEGRPLTTGPAASATANDQADGPAPARFSAVDGRAAARATKDDVVAALASGATCVVDALPASTFDGTDPGYGPRGGHITGAVNVPFRSVVDGETALFPDAGELRRRLDDSGLLDQEAVITYCGGAIAATVDAFALALLGHDRVSVYDASLMEWSADDSLPMSNS